MRRIKNLVKRVLFPALHSLGIYDRSIERHHKQKILVLTGHRVSSSNRQKQNGVPPLELEKGIPSERFEMIMRFLRERMNPVSLVDIVDFVTGRKPVPDRAISVTLDDGYLDNYMNAFPILKKYEIPATIFLATGFVDNDLMFWWDRVGEALKRTRVKRLQMQAVKDCLGRQGQHLPAVVYLHNQQQREDAWELLTSTIRWCHSDRVEKVVRTVEDLLEVRTEDYRDLHRTLTWGQVLEMNKNGIDFGAHTVSHPLLQTLTLAECEQELLQPKKEIEEKIQKPVVSFAYPFGDLGKDQQTAIKKKLVEYGFQCAFSVERGYVCRGSDPFELKRVGMGDLPLGMTMREWTAVLRQSVC